VAADKPPLTLTLGLAPHAIRTWLGLAGPGGEIQLTDHPLLDALTAGASLEHLLEIGTPRAGRDVLGVLDVLHTRQLLAWQWRDVESNVWALLTPLRSDVPLPLPPDVGLDGRLSRFALVREEAGDWVIESGRSPLAARLSGAAVAALACGQAPAPLLALLHMGQLLNNDDDTGLARYWEFHDRYFAARSRFDSAGAGATFRFTGIHDPEPFDARPPHQTANIALPVPDANEVGPGLWEVTEKRRSHLELGNRPMELRDLGSLLWRTLRVTESLPRDLSVATSYDVVRRPVPSAGGTHSIGLWLAIRDVEGVDTGVWWYDPSDHALLRTGDYPQGSIDESTPVYGMLLSRHPRLAWKYQGIAHALALKDSGVILHALQLGAAALGLAMCPIGSGPTATVLESLELDADEYVPVGEFWLAMPR
jgi:SagB-type dehydrogenase family enzyme